MHRPSRACMHRPSARMHGDPTCEWAWGPGVSMCAWARCVCAWRPSRCGGPVQACAHGPDACVHGDQVGVGARCKHVHIGPVHACIETKQVWGPGASVHIWPNASMHAWPGACLHRDPTSEQAWGPGACIYGDQAGVGTWCECARPCE